MAEVKRGFRKVMMVLPVKDYETLRQIAEANDREVGQQAAFMLKTGIAVHRTNNPSAGEYVIEEVVKSPTWDNGQVEEPAGVE